MPPERGGPARGQTDWRVGPYSITDITIGPIEYATRAVAQEEAELQATAKQAVKAAMKARIDHRLHALQHLLDRRIEVLTDILR